MLLAGWWTRLTGTECAECGEPQSAFASICARCGAGNRARLGALAIVGALAAFAAAALVALMAVVVGWQQAPKGAAAPASAAANGKFAWLTTAMHDCDTLAAKEPDTLHFLVIPLAVAPNNQANWQSKALNKVGNGILLRSDVALEGLKGKELAISKTRYIFAVRDQAQVMYKWDRSSGIAKFSIPNAGSVDGFSIQFQGADGKAGDNWGNTFARKKGNCYWVNVVLEN
jgi:hypothetical protein